MPVFTDIIIEWRGGEYRIPADGVMRAIAVVEQVVTVSELMLISTGHRSPSFSRLSAAFGALVRHLGGRVSDEEIYEQMFEGTSEKHALRMALDQLLQVATPASTRRRIEAEVAKAEQERLEADRDRELAGERAAVAAAEIVAAEGVQGNSRPAAPAS